MIKEEKEKNDFMANKEEIHDYKGQIFVKAEWKGNGPKLPPIKSENLFKQTRIEKNRKRYDVDMAQKMLLK